MLDRGPFGAIMPTGEWGVKIHKDEPGDWRGILDLSPAVADALGHNGRERIRVFYQRVASHLRSAASHECRERSHPLTHASSLPSSRFVSRS